MLETDRRLAGLYVMLDRVDLHCTWVSRAVLDLLGDDLPEAVPGRGVFCDKAMDLVLPLWPRPGAEEKKAYLRSAMRDLHAVGLVGVHDAGVFPRDMALLEDMSRTDDWRLRVYAMVECAERNGFCPESARRIYVEGKTGMLSVRSVKLFSGTVCTQPHACESARLTGSRWRPWELGICHA